MGNIYLVRHGQAGTREDYDSLSELGKRQARLLGDYLNSQGINFSAAYCGSMQRQQQTASEIMSTITAAGNSFPKTITDCRWDEFDLARIYQELAPVLSEADEEFRVEYEEMILEVRQSAGAHEAEVHRRWRPCDTKMVETWVAGHLPYTGETWNQFCDRVSTCESLFKEHEPHENIIVFTSATPTAVLTSNALNVKDKQIRQLAGALYNSSYTLLHRSEMKLRLIQFNAVPHLTEPSWRTHR